MKTFATLSTLAAVAVALPFGHKKADTIQPGGPAFGTGLSAFPSFTGTGASVPFPTGSGFAFPTGHHHHHHEHGTGVPGAAAPTGFAPSGTAPAFSEVTAAPSLKARSPFSDPFKSDIIPGSAFTFPGFGGGASKSGFALPTGGFPAGSGALSYSLPTETASGFASKGTGSPFGFFDKEKKQHVKGTGIPSFSGLPVPTGFTTLPTGASTGLPSGGFPGLPSATGSGFSFTALPTAYAGKP